MISLSMATPNTLIRLGFFKGPVFFRPQAPAYKYCHEPRCPQLQFQHLTMKSFIILSCLVAVALAVPANQVHPRKLSTTIIASFRTRLFSPFVHSLVFQGRVSDGLNALPGSAPFTCSIRWGISNRSHSCGASLLNSMWFITAAHCLGVSTGSYDIQCGATNRIEHTSTEQVRTWADTDVHYHPGWTGSIYSDDIVIVRVNQPFSFNSYVKGVLLRAADADDHENVGRIFGWGSRDGSSNVAQNNLQTAEMDIINASTCRQRMTTIAGASTANFITNNDICAGRGTYAVCGGDSGSPLIRTIDGYHVLVGMAVWGLSPCGRIDGAPSVFSRISAYTNWIEGQIGQNLS